jgi:hypothetical protein
MWNFQNGIVVVTQVAPQKEHQTQTVKCKVDSWRETQVMGTPFYSVKILQIQRHLWSRLLFPVRRKQRQKGNLMDTAVMTASSEVPLKKTHDPPPDTEKMMLCECSQQRSSPQSEVTDQNLQSETPCCDLPIESVQEAQGIRCWSGCRQPNRLSANDTGCRLSYLDAESLVLPLSQIKNVALSGSISTQALMWAWQPYLMQGLVCKQRLFWDIQFCFSMFGYGLCY